MDTFIRPYRQHVAHDFALRLARCPFLGNECGVRLCRNLGAHVYEFHVVHFAPGEKTASVGVISRAAEKVRAARRGTRSPRPDCLRGRQSGFFKSVAVPLGVMASSGLVLRALDSIAGWSEHVRAQVMAGHDAIACCFNRSHLFRGNSPPHAPVADHVGLYADA